MDDVIDSERRPLRPIGTSAREVHSRTAGLLARFNSRPGVHVLVDSVAWPAGSYSTTPDGQVLCDGTYIGQSIDHLVVAVRRLRLNMPGKYRIEAAVVVHPSRPDAPTLPLAHPDEVRWFTPAELADHLHGRLGNPSCHSDSKFVTMSH